MKRKKLVTLLFTIFASACMALAGCGTKEVVSEEPIISEQTSSEEVVSEEISEEEPVEEPSVEANLDIVIELIPELQAAKDEAFPVGVETTMEFGTLTRLGDNKDYPNALEDIKISCNGETFQMSLPKDMCMSYSWNAQSNTLVLFNEDRSKIAHLVFGNAPLDVNEKNVLADTESINNTLTKLGYDTIDNVEVVNIENTETTMSQRIPVNSGNYVGEFMYCQTYGEEIFEATNSNNETVMCVDCMQSMFFYGDTTKECADEISAYVMESFRVVKEENSHIFNVNTELNQNNILNSDAAKKYGIPENLQIPSNAEIIDVNGMFNIKIEKTYKEDVILFLDEFNEKIEIIDKRNDIVVFSGKEAIDYLNYNIDFRGTYELNGISYSLNLSEDEDNYYISIIQY